MNDLEVPYLPISEFDVSEASKEFLHFKNEESNDQFDLKNLNGKDFPEQIGLILLGMGMEKYIELFKKMNITLDTFLNISESELQEIGIVDANDRWIIAKNLSIHRKNTDYFIVSENHIEDLNIIKNVSYQLLLLQNYCAYVEIQMRKQIMTDYAVDSEDSACTFLKAFAECALTQSQIMSSSIYDANSSEALIHKLLKIYNLTLPEALQDSLPRKKGSKRLLKVMVFIGFSSIVLLSGRYLLRRS